jgi:hypothetical protein
MWRLLLDNNIHLLCIPAHSSNIFQIMDLLPNSIIKRNLQKVIPLKSNYKKDEDIIKFIVDVEKCISKGLTKDIICDGFLITLLKILKIINIHF